MLQAEHLCPKKGFLKVANGCHCHPSFLPQFKTMKRLSLAPPLLQSIPPQSGPRRSQTPPPLGCSWLVSEPHAIGAQVLPEGAEGTLIQVEPYVRHE